MPLLRWLIAGAALSLFALSLWFHIGVGARFSVGGPPAASPTERTVPFKKFDTRSEAGRICGKNNTTHMEEITPTESKDAGYTCSDPRISK